MPHRNLLLLFAAVVISYACYVRADQNPYARYAAAGYAAIDHWSLQDIPDQELFEGAMQGMIKVLRDSGDEHSAFVNERQRDNFREELTQQFGGVGVRIRMLGEPPLPMIVGPPEPDTPAFRAKLRSGDYITAIDGQSTNGMSRNDILESMRGLAGDPVKLTIRHLGKEQEQQVELTRAIITVDSIYGDLRDQNALWEFRWHEDSRIGYLRITKFGDKTQEEITNVLANLTNPRRTKQGKRPIEGLILDVRDNAGGALDAAVGISDLFLRAGQTIVTTRGRDQKTRDRFVSTGKGSYLKIPMAVLINNDSASASEILAACLQDYGRAVIVGQRSYGKGTVQRLFTRVESGRSVLKLTTATYWRPSEQNIHRMPNDDESATWGVRPDPEFEVLLDKEQHEQWQLYRYHRDILGEQPNEVLSELLAAKDGDVPDSYVDLALQRAVEYLQRQMDAR